MADPAVEGRKLSRSFGRLALLGTLLVVAGPVGPVYTGVATRTSMLLFDRPHSSLYDSASSSPWPLLFDGLGLIAIGVGGRRIVSMVEDRRATGELPGTPTGEDQNRSKG